MCAFWFPLLIYKSPFKVSLENTKFSCGYHVLSLQEGVPFQGPRVGSCLTLRKMNCQRRHTCWHIYRLYWEGASLVAQRLKRLPAMQETWVRSLGQEDPWKRKWQPTPVFLRGESHGQRSLVGYSPRGRKESDTTEWLHFHSWPLSTQMARGNALHLGKFPRLHHFSHSTTSPTGFILLGIHFGTGTLNSPLNIGFAF